MYIDEEELTEFINIRDPIKNKVTSPKNFCSKMTSTFLSFVFATDFLSSLVWLTSYNDKLWVGFLPDDPLITAIARVSLSSVSSFESCWF